MKSVGPLSVGEKLIGPPAHAMEKKKKKTGVTGVTTQEQSGRRCWSRRPGRMVLPPSATGPGALQDRQAVGVLVAHEARVTQRTQQHHDHRHRHPLGSWKNRDYTTQGVPGRVIYIVHRAQAKRRVINV